MIGMSKNDFLHQIYHIKNVVQNIICSNKI